MGNPIGAYPNFGGNTYRHKTEIQINRERDTNTYKDVFFIQVIDRRISPPSQERHGPYSHEEMLAVLKLLTEGD